MKPSEWQQKCNEEDEKELAVLVQKIDDAMLMNAPSAQGDLSKFIFTFGGHEALPNARVIARVKNMYMSSADRPDGWSNVQFNLDTRGGESYITFTA